MGDLDLGAPGALPPVGQTLPSSNRRVQASITEHNPPAVNSADRAAVAPVQAVSGAGQGAQITGKVDAFSRIFEIQEGLDFSNGVTYDQLKKSDGSAAVTKELFDLIANGMATKDENQGTDTVITSDEIEKFMDNVIQFADMAGLPPTGENIANAAQLYNKGGVTFKRVNVEEFKAFSEKVSAGTDTCVDVDAVCSKIAENLSGSNITKEMVKSELDRLSLRFKQKQFEISDKEEIFSKFLFSIWCRSNGIDADELYGMKGVERIDRSGNSGSPTQPAGDMMKMGNPVMSFGSEAITDEEIGSIMKANMEREIKSDTGLTLGPKGKAQKIFQQIMVSKAGQAHLKELAGSHVTEEEAKAWLSKQDGNPPATPENIEIARMGVFAEKCETDKALEAEANSKLGQSMDALKIANMEGLVASINSAITDPAQQVTAQDINVWIDEAKKSMKQITEMMQKPAEVSPSAQLGKPEVPGKSDENKLMTKMQAAYQRAPEAKKAMVQEYLVRLGELGSPQTESERKITMDRISSLSAELGDVLPKEVSAAVEAEKAVGDIMEAVNKNKIQDARTLYDQKVKDSDSVEKERKQLLDTQIRIRENIEAGKYEDAEKCLGEISGKLGAPQIAGLQKLIDARKATSDIVIEASAAPAEAPAAPAVIEDKGSEWISLVDGILTAATAANFSKQASLYSELKTKMDSDPALKPLIKTYLDGKTGLDNAAQEAAGLILDN